MCVACNLRCVALSRLTARLHSLAAQLPWRTPPAGRWLLVAGQPCVFIRRTTINRAWAVLDLLNLDAHFRSAGACHYRPCIALPGGHVQLPRRHRQLPRSVGGAALRFSSVLRPGATKGLKSSSWSKVCVLDLYLSRAGHHRKYLLGRRAAVAGGPLSHCQLVPLAGACLRWDQST